MPLPRLQWLDLLWALVGIGVAGGLVGVVGGGVHLNARPVTPLPRAALLSGIFGLAGYIYYGLGLPGSRLVDAVMPGLRGLVVGFVCGLVPLLLMFVLARFRDR